MQPVEEQMRSSPFLQSGNTQNMGEIQRHWKRWDSRNSEPLDQHPDTGAISGFFHPSLAALGRWQPSWILPTAHCAPPKGNPKGWLCLHPKAEHPATQDQPGSSTKQLKSSCANTAKEDSFPKATLKLWGKQKIRSHLHLCYHRHWKASVSYGPSRAPPQTHALPSPFPSTLPSRTFLASSNTILRALFILLLSHAVG